MEIGYYFLQSGEYNECDSICTLKISLYYIYKFMCEDKNCCYTAKRLPYISYFDWLQDKSYTNVMSRHKSISQNHLLYVYIHYTHIYICTYINVYTCVYVCIYNPWYCCSARKLYIGWKYTEKRQLKVPLLLDIILFIVWDCVEISLSFYPEGQ